ncbi:alpha-glucosidase C-terminal domain-containing protein [bacterium BMS3Abin03]|jgi:amylosucrase|nr:alpha-glucosidase C-terminal domain-containing protein [bacterium BMS3Abin03]MCG6959061.1 alpha-glucosidase C-terminal domain-containing protein [bacterium BMS3Abin03]
MQDNELTAKRAASTLKRLLPLLTEKYKNKVEEGEWLGYIQRLEKYFPKLFELLQYVYGTQYDFFYHLSEILNTATQAWIDRPAELKALDAIRENDPLWYQSNRMVGAVCYVDLFSVDLKGMKEKIPYLKELGITYLHLMPIFKSPEGDNDGGYAVSSYRDIDAELGTMEDLKELAGELRNQGISLVLDFVFNHTSDEHEWAKLALSGNEEFQDYYRMFNGREIPDQFEKTITPVFQNDHPGCFTYRSRIKKWVWTTFHNYQWDLNYENPAVFNSMAADMLFLSNAGVEILRLDAVAFIWKKLGTNCENLPEAHTIIKAFNAVMKIVAPSFLFKSEAIVHPDEVNKYISEDECQLSYNPQMMALLWESLATGKTVLLRHALEKRFNIPKNCMWVNYIRCHDDIGWTFSNEDAEELGINPAEHRTFLSDFYIGRFKGSFAKGLPFQEDPNTKEGRVSGTTASLAGLEQALEENDKEKIDLAISRILLLHGVILTIGGIPLIYIGDGIGMLNDYDYEKSPEKVGDTRWIHRPDFDWERLKEKSDPESIIGKIFNGLLKLIRLREKTQALSGSETEFADTGNDNVLAYFRNYESNSVFVLANFSNEEQNIAGNRLRLLGLSKTITDIVGGKTITATQNLTLEPYQFMVLIGVR